MSDTITLADIDQIKAKVTNHVRPQLIDGRLCYVVVMSSPQLHDIKVMQARDDWRDYYRSVRILRKLRATNMSRFLQFSRLWWKEFYQFEDKGPQLETRIAEIASMRANRQPRKLP